MGEQRASQLEAAIESALRELHSGPPLSAFGIAREDCALAHIDYFGSIEIASHALCSALAEARGTTAAAIFSEFGNKSWPCDCRACIGKEAAEAAREKHREAYTNVKEWHESEEA